MFPTVCEERSLGFFPTEVFPFDLGGRFYSSDGDLFRVWFFPTLPLMVYADSAQMADSALIWTILSAIFSGNPDLCHKNGEFVSIKVVYSRIVSQPILN